MDPVLALVMIALLLWLVLPLPLAVLIGRCIRAGEAGDAVRRHARPEPETAHRFVDAA